MLRVMTQLSVHTENRAGTLADLTETLDAADVNIVAVYAPDSENEYGTVRLLPDKVSAGKAALERAGYSHTPVDVLVMELPHRPGSLARAARVLSDNQVEIRYAYASILAGSTAGLCILRLDDLERGREILEREFAPE